MKGDCSQQVRKKGAREGGVRDKYNNIETETERRTAAAPTRSPTQQQLATSHRHHHLLRRSIRPAAAGAGRRRKAPQALSPPANEAFRESKPRRHRGDSSCSPTRAAPDRSCYPRPRPRLRARSRSKGESSAPRSNPPPRSNPTRRGRGRQWRTGGQWRPRHLTGWPRTHYLGAGELEFGCENFALGSELG